MKEALLASPHTTYEGPQRPMLPGRQYKVSFSQLDLYNNEKNHWCYQLETSLIKCIKCLADLISREIWVMGLKSDLRFLRSEVEKQI